MLEPLVIQGLWGLGDNIYQRPFVRAASKRFDVYLETPWPEIYLDLPIKFIRAERELYTQLQNVRRQPASRWSAPPPGVRAVRPFYGAIELRRASILQALEQTLPLYGERLVMDLPALPACPIESERPIALFRPVTVRSEWRNEARNPDPRYLVELADRLRATHTIVVVGSIRTGKEWLAGPAPRGDIELLAGIEDPRDLFALFAAADIAIGGVGWIVPAAIALKQRAFIVLGGHGGHNRPERITDPRLDLSNLGFAFPQRFCQCESMLHSCDKTIPNLMRQFEDFVASHPDAHRRCSIGSAMVA